MSALYDKIGSRYAEFRQTDPTIAKRIHIALGTSFDVLNVGAGSGSYEPSDRSVVALEPSQAMIRQRPADAAPVIQGSATALPFSANSFDAVMAVLTLHHWSDQAQGVREMKRVARDRIVILTWDSTYRNFWLADYFPKILELETPAFPGLSFFEDLLGSLEVSKVPVPHDCKDGFFCAYWRRPEAYLDADVRASISTFAKLGDIEMGLKRLESDLKSGEWRRRYSEVLSQSELEFGYRLIVAKP